MSKYHCVNHVCFYCEISFCKHVFTVKYHSVNHEFTVKILFCKTCFYCEISLFLLPAAKSFCKSCFYCQCANHTCTIGKCTDSVSNGSACAFKIIEGRETGFNASILVRRSLLLADQTGKCYTCILTSGNDNGLVIPNHHETLDKFY